MYKEYIVSWDIAKQQDATVVQVWRQVPQVIGEKYNERIFTFWDCIRLVKWEQIPYTEQVRRVSLILGSAELKNNHDLLIDGTGVGQAIADMIREAKLSPIEIVFSGGAKPQELYMGNSDKRFGSGMDMNVLRGYSVPKVDMIGAAQTILEEHRIPPIADIPYASEFERQLLHFQGKVNEKGHTTYGNDNEAKHDDFVASFLMFCWWVKYCEGNRTNDIEKPVNKTSKNYDWNPLKEFNI